jgi:hypothetical protein
MLECRLEPLCLVAAFCLASWWTDDIRMDSAGLQQQCDFAHRNGTAATVIVGPFAVRIGAEQLLHFGRLVLAAATGSEGPGPLISTFSRNAGEFSIPIVIVPGNLSDADLDTMS